MKLKYYLRGLGIGILITTIILGISQSQKTTLAEQEIIRQANELGMVMADTEQTISEALAESENGTEDATESATESGIEAGVETGIENAAAGEPSVDAPEAGNPEDQAEVQEPQAVPQVQPEPVAFTVNKGESPRIVSENLFAAGLIDNSDGFLQYLKDQGLTNDLQIGTYQITPGSDYGTIAVLLVTNTEG